MALRIAFSGFVVLVVAMGIGRFAFTPQVPLMMTAGQLTLTSAGLVAAMNYLGYLVGAWDAMRAHRFVETRLWLGIFGAVALTLLSAAADNAIVHGLLRFAIGCMAQNSRQDTSVGTPHLCRQRDAGANGCGNFVLWPHGAHAATRYRPLRGSAQR